MIGAGIGQFFMAQKIKARGHYLMTVTLPGDYPVINIADRVYYENVFDKEKVLDIAVKEQIDAVISDQNDMMMPTVAYVAEHMGIPGNTVEQVNMYCNKNVFRDNCDKLNIPVPKHFAVSKVEMPDGLVDVPFPWIVKPADSQSSVGVSKINNKEEYMIAIAKAIEISKSGTAIVEEFFQGNELVAEGFIYKGKYYNIGYADRKYFNLENIFIPSQTIFPSCVSEDILNKIYQCECTMANYVRPEFAIVHSEYLYDYRTSKFCVVESALRGGGVYISSHLIPLYSDIDINETIIDCILGNDIDMKQVFSNKTSKSSAYICFYLPEGKIVRTTGFEDIKSLTSVKFADIDKIKPGMVSPQLMHKGQRLGPIIIAANNRLDIEKEIELVRRKLHIIVESSDGNFRDINWQ